MGCLIALQLYCTEVAGRAVIGVNAASLIRVAVKELKLSYHNGYI